MEFTIIGQPNCGKSTIFNEVVGYKAVASNFPGVTVKYTKGEIDFENEKITVVDLPGTYSSQTTDEAELVSVKYIRNASNNSVIINIIDASVLSRSLELTIQLLSLQRPMVVALNMVDEAERKGIKIDPGKLSKILDVPVIETIGRKGRGVYNLFKKAYESGKKKIIPDVIEFDTPIESVLNSLGEYLKSKNVPERWNYRFLALKLLEHDKMLQPFFKEYLSEDDFSYINTHLQELEETTGKHSEFISHSIRHDLAFKIFEDVATVKSNIQKDIRYKMDNILMHPIGGYFLMMGILYSTFWIIFSIGNMLEPVFLENIYNISSFFENMFGKESVASSIINGIIQGLGGGIGIVIPFLLPFFILLSFLEDTGYLARIAYLIDNLMHKIGLHGLSIVPMILGYGCTVPGILATRILKSPRDKIITATLTTLVPCSAKMTVIFGLVGFFISMKAAILIYVINLIIIGFTGKFLSKAMPEISPGLILEIPKYHLPSIKSILSKTWFRLKEFVIIAWPLLIIGSIILELINHLDLSNGINAFLSPFTVGVLGLPSVVGITLVFGIMRKELALILLFSALGTSNILSQMNLAQIFSFTIFVTFYIPCLATFAALVKELDIKKALAITLLTIIIAIVLAVAVRFGFSIF